MVQTHEYIIIVSPGETPTHREPCAVGPNRASGASQIALLGSGKPPTRRNRVKEGQSQISPSADSLFNVSPLSPTEPNRGKRNAPTQWGVAVQRFSSGGANIVCPP